MKVVDTTRYLAGVQQTTTGTDIDLSDSTSAEAAPTAQNSPSSKDKFLSALEKVTPETSASTTY